ncbi:hypothetical protein AY599_18880 [Leptolyngbya valderiana BDU 20041]|nr:hypothetical protein AY599_18880 [Leptolyngbya valderiana BDU 20041]PPT09524.1 hypothetical protein CKA32_000566 [Geitlerinema sp. FC II]
MSSPKPWTCTGKDKNGNPGSAGEHPPHQNFGEFCTHPSGCSLTRNDVAGGGGGDKKLPKWLVPAGAAAGAAAVLGGIVLATSGGGGSKPNLGTARGGGNCLAVSSTDVVSQSATNGEYISQGEKILLPPTNPQSISQKEEAAEAFAEGDWQRAIEKYQLAANADPNDPETKIYLNNARARKQSKGAPRTIAVAIPISTSPDEAKEILRGVALSQDQFNNETPTPSCLMEVALVDVGDSETSIDLAQDLVDSPAIVGVLGHGSDEFSQAAVQVYQDGGLTVLSPLTMSVSMSPGGQSILKVLPYQEGSGQMLDGYLTQTSKTLIDYARTQLVEDPVVAVFFNSDINYSKRLKDRFVMAMEEERVSVTPLDITSDLPTLSGVNADNTITSATQAGANVAFMALTKDRLTSAISIAQANAEQNRPLLMLGADELFSPTILIEGEDAIEDLVLAIPWRWTPEDPFAMQASAMWRGRVSWRTATSFDATEAIAATLRAQNDEGDGGLDRAGVAEQLRRGEPISGVAADFDVFRNGIPLVQAVRGEGGPRGSDYRFDPIEDY